MKSLASESFELKATLPRGLCEPSDSPSYHIIPPNRSQANLTTDFWRWGYSVPDQAPKKEGYQGPFNDPKGIYASLNQSGPVFFLAGPLFVNPGAPNPKPITRNITVPGGKEIFFPVMNVEWDNAQLQAFFGIDDPATLNKNENFFEGLPNNGILSPEELRNLNEATMATATAVFCTVDGDTLFSDANWGDDNLMRYRQVTPDLEGFEFTVPADNALGIPLEATDDGQGLITGAMSDGIWVYLELDRGLHQISFGGVFELGSINVDLDGNRNPHQSATEIAYQKALSQYGGLVLSVTNNIWQL